VTPGTQACPQCGSANRVGAKFCVRCGKALHTAPVQTEVAPKPAAAHQPPMTTKVCPQCMRTNPVPAATCAYCGHRFRSAVRTSTPQDDVPDGSMATPAKSRRTWGYWIAGLFILLFIAALAWAGYQLMGARPAPQENVPVVTAIVPTSVPTAIAPTLVVPTPLAATPEAEVSTPLPQPTAISGTTTLQRALLSAVQLLVRYDTGNGASLGSGTVLSSDGFILTNYHVIGDPDTRRLYNREGIVFVGISPPDLASEAEILYQAQLVEADYELDLALLKITARANGSPLTTALNLDFLTIGDSNSVSIGDELTIIGFPGLGGSTVTLTRGTVSGFLPDEGWIKTDAEINPGNSGGVATNATGQLIGVPTMASAADVERVPGKLGLVRPINMASHLLSFITTGAIGQQSTGPQSSGGRIEFVREIVLNMTGSRQNILLWLPKSPKSQKDCTWGCCRRVGCGVLVWFYVNN
jgi:S1-C subfamily serine protease